MCPWQVEERKHLPTLREFLHPVVEDMDPENCIEDEYRVGCFLQRLCSHCSRMMRLHEPGHPPGAHSSSAPLATFLL